MAYLWINYLYALCNSEVGNLWCINQHDCLPLFWLFWSIYGKYKIKFTKMSQSTTAFPCFFLPRSSVWQNRFVFWCFVTKQYWGMQKMWGQPLICNQPPKFTAEFAHKAHSAAVAMYHLIQLPLLSWQIQQLLNGSTDHLSAELNELHLFYYFLLSTTGGAVKCRACCWKT